MAKADRTTAEPDLMIALADGTPITRIPETTRQQLQFFSTRLELGGGGVPASIAVTSALSGEGVTFIASALAAVLSEDLGRRTCLIDANWSTPDPALDHDGAGLGELLLGEAQLSEVILQTRYARLSVIPRGELSSSDQSRLATSERMAKVLRRLAEHGYDHVVLDVAAVAESTSALTVAAAADAALLVARQRMVRRDQIEAAIDDLRPTRLLGIVLNGHRLHMPEFLQRRLLDA